MLRSLLFLTCKKHPMERGAPLCPEEHAYPSAAPSACSLQGPRIIWPGHCLRYLWLQISAKSGDLCVLDDLYAEWRPLQPCMGRQAVLAWEGCLPAKESGWLFALSLGRYYLKSAWNRSLLALHPSLPVLSPHSIWLGEVSMGVQLNQKQSWCPWDQSKGIL